MDENRDIGTKETIDRNIEAVHSVRRLSDEKRRSDQKIVDTIASFMGSTTSIYVHLALYGGWVGANLILDGQAKSFEIMSLIASLEAIF